MNSDLAKLQPYPFEKLAQLKAGVEPNPSLEHIALSIGEPKHPTPGFITEEVLSHLHGLSVYPLIRGSDRLRETIAAWLCHRFQLSAVDPASQILPCNGTREALFAFAQAVVERNKNPLVMMPNPFYQIYEGAALLAGAEPHFLTCDASNGFLPDFGAVSAADWQRCQLLFLCNPANPTGAVTNIETLQKLINLADKFDFIIASDECYSEIYFDETAPPAGLLQAASLMGNSDFKRCMVFHSLSKRSNAPGLRKVLFLNWPLTVLLITVAGVGFLMLYSVAGGSFQPWAEPQMTRFALGLAVMLVVAMIPIWFLRNIALVAYGVTVLLLLAVEFFGVVGMGAQRWIDLGFMRLQPSELMKITLIMLLAAYYDWLPAKRISRPLWVVLPALLILVPTFL
ncbi:MAG: aminotransferase class I/II-fold pyridoxal phosphate-dependent enzyme, partial [Candidatus Polarisedimenticolaceae bacterium]|nr:aminotransferase class I/II-fold pyridoxal phosphate-dependent enzyme [Candidatus Polarisedimenticolaceae bacterium]